MLYLLFIDRLPVFAVLLVMHLIAFWGILKKMGLKRIYALIPFAADKKIGDTMFETRYAFRHPFLFMVLFFLFAMYFQPFAERVSPGQKVYGYVFLILGYLNYYGYLTRLYWRLGKSFGKNWLFRIGMILFPAPFLLALGLNKKNVFLHGTPIRLGLLRPKAWFRYLMRFVSILFFLGEAVLTSMIVGFLILKVKTPWPIIEVLQQDIYESTKDITGDGTEVLREENMQDNYAQFASIAPSREKFFADKSDVESVVVMEYVIGSDLEFKLGAASTNVKQFADATKQGSALKFVMECGGSYRWFTNGIEKNSVGRYVMEDGKLNKVMDIDSYTTMSSKDELLDFITWTKENYPADRYMLVLWDHGGGLSAGYGQDDLNKRSDGKGSTIMVDEIVSAIKESGMKFDMIGFDACLMQDIEIAKLLEPYADYYMASEESEPSGGWFYTSGFGMLAKNPAIPTEEFAREVIGTYDEYNKQMASGTEDNTYTLSLVDLTYVNPAYEKLEALFRKQEEAILASESDYADISLAANSAYKFMNDEQLDLVHYLSNLQMTDYNDSVMSDSEINELIAYAQACVVARNRRSAEGINGLAFTFPYSSLSSYTKCWEQLKSNGLAEQEKFYTDFFSIMAASRKPAPSDGSDSFMDELLALIDYTDEEWYKPGFEDYVTTQPIIEIPVRRNGDGYSLELSDSVWAIISDERQFYYQETEEGLMYLGSDYAGNVDENGHLMITADGTWISIDGHPVFYEPTGVRTDENGDIYTGYTKAILNRETEVLLYIEWAPSDDENAPAEGRIIGYDEVDNPDAYMERGHSELEAGQTLDFLFDYYDEEGNSLGSKTAFRRYRVRKPDEVIVTDGPLGRCTLRHGVLLTDVYQRKFQSEIIVTEITE